MSLITSVKRLPVTKSKQYNNKNVHYPYHYPDSTLIRKQHENFNIVLPQSTSDKSLYFYTSHNDLQHILQRRELYGYRYQFTLRSAETRLNVVHSVLWDYETGHVRISPMFKSSEYEYLRRKNTPRRWVDRNNLNNCYASTTGGRIEAQARALSSKFCWSTRYALTPIFGNDFPRLCDAQRQVLHDIGIGYGTELSLDIDKDIVDAVNARQAVLDWSMILSGRDTTFLRRTSLPSLERCWSTYISHASKNPILPPLKDPRKLAVGDTTSHAKHAQAADEQQSFRVDHENPCRKYPIELTAISENVLCEVQQRGSADLDPCLRLNSGSKDLEVYRMFDLPDMRLSDMNAARSLMELRYGVSWSRTL